MLWPKIAKCYSELLEDPSLLKLFSEKQGTSLWELQLLGALQFRLILERVFAHIAFPVIWENTRVEIVIDTGSRTSGEITPMAILITDWVGEENLGMVTVFCHHDQNKNGDICCTLCPTPAWLPQPRVVVVRRYTNTPYIPWRTSQLLYLDVSTLSGVLPPSISLWTAYAYESYFHTLRLRCSYLTKRKNWV